ncbi:MAG: hypothetical protein NTV93_11290 [Verrucomicrobia bacterium]|nr:hypothetical protein [Verrucomicrobiota bacterium]
MKILKLLAVASIILACCASLHAGEPIDIKGDFALCTNPPFPNGWLVNSPGYWEDTDTAERHPIEGKDGFSLLLTAGEKPIHLFSGIYIDVSEGQVYVVKAKVKGTGSGAVGVYWHGESYPAFKKFVASSDWEEIVVELKVPSAAALGGAVPITRMTALLVVDPGSSIEFSDVSIELGE